MGAVAAGPPPAVIGSEEPPQAASRAAMTSQGAPRASFPIMRGRLLRMKCEGLQMPGTPHNGLRSDTLTINARRRWHAGTMLNVRGSGKLQKSVGSLKVQQ